VNGPHGVGGTYEVKANEKDPHDHSIFVHYTDGKVWAEVDGGVAEGHPTVLLTPLTDSTAKYQPELGIPLDGVCEFVTREGKKGIVLFGLFHPKVG
jgi:hypothetical protein